MDWFDEREMPYHEHMYRRFIKWIRYIVLAHATAAAFVAFTFFIRGGSWVAGIFFAVIVLAGGLFYIGRTAIHPHAGLIVAAHAGLRRRPMLERRY